MMHKNKLLHLLLLLAILLLASCSSSPQTAPKVDNKYDKLAEEKNSELELEAIELTNYSEEVGATLSNPTYKKFVVNDEVVIEGHVEEHHKLKSNYAWIKIRADEEGPAGREHEYYAPINEGDFKETIHFFNGEGEYRIQVMIPSTDRENYYYDLATFEVINVNPNMQRDTTYTPHGIEAGLSLKMSSSYTPEDEILTLKGEATHLSDEDTIMIALKKGSDKWQHPLPIKNGAFAYDVPLFYGEGLHELEVLVPDKKRKDYYQVATTILVDNQSSRTMKPIDFYTLYLERGVELEYPLFGGETGGSTFHIKGKIDPKAELASETTHLYINVKKDKDESLEVIPVTDYTFDDTFHLRFGPCTYEVTVNVPEIKERNSNYFRFFGVAKFEVESNAQEDQRDLLLSRGVPSDNPEIISLAKEITKGKASNYEKAKAIYTYVAKNIAYDVDKYRNKLYSWDDDALKALQLKSGVCQDYAYLAIALLRASEVEARLVEGRAGGGIYGNLLGESHAWVEAKVDGNWLIMDPTWGGRLC